MQLDPGMKILGLPERLLPLDKVHIHPAGRHLLRQGGLPVPVPARQIRLFQKTEYGPRAEITGTAEPCALLPPEGVELKRPVGLAPFFRRDQGSKAGNDTCRPVIVPALRYAVHVRAGGDDRQ